MTCQGKDEAFYRGATVFCRMCAPGLSLAQNEENQCRFSPAICRSKGAGPLTTSGPAIFFESSRPERTDKRCMRGQKTRRASGAPKPSFRAAMPTHPPATMRRVPTLPPTLRRASFLTSRRKRRRTFLFATPTPIWRAKTSRSDAAHATAWKTSTRTRCASALSSGATQAQIFRGASAPPTNASLTATPSPRSTTSCRSNSTRRRSRDTTESLKRAPS